MANSDAFYADDDVASLLKEHSKVRGDKSKIVNEAVRQYFLPKTKEGRILTPELQNLRVKI